MKKLMILLIVMLIVCGFAFAKKTHIYKTDDVKNKNINKANTLILGNIITMDESNAVCEAVVVKDGIIKYVGSKATAEKLCDKSTRVLDYGNNYVYPGFIEGHCHGSLAAVVMSLSEDLSSGETMDDYVNIMKQAIEQNQDAEHYWGSGWQIRDKEPNKEMLDAICPNKPMALNSIDGHSMWMNSKALEYFEIDDKAVKKWGSDIIRTFADGKPTGYISEGPVTEITVKMNTYSDAELKKALLKWQEFALSLGITAYYDAGIYREQIARVYSELINEGKWKIRVYAGWTIDENSRDYRTQVRKAKEMADKYNSEYFKIIGLKIYMDGVVEAHTAWLTEDYIDKPGYTGVRRFCDLEKTVELYKEANKYGFNVHQHTVGDGAVKFALDCIERAQIETGNMDMRNALAHIQLAGKEDIKRMANLNVIAVLAPLWMYKEPGYYSQAERYLGSKRAFMQYPLKSINDAFCKIAFHTDYPISPDVSMPKTIYIAQKRNAPDCDDSAQLNYNEGLDRKAAVIGITKGPAYEVKEENSIGTLKIGYIANMSVFDRNFLTDNITDVAHSNIIATIIDGQEVYKNPN